METKDGCVTHKTEPVDSAEVGALFQTKRPTSTVRLHSRAGANRLATAASWLSTW